MRCSWRLGGRAVIACSLAGASCSLRTYSHSLFERGCRPRSSFQQGREWHTEFCEGRQKTCHEVCVGQICDTCKRTWIGGLKHKDQRLQCMGEWRAGSKARIANAIPWTGNLEGVQQAVNSSWCPGQARRCSSSLNAAFYYWLPWSGE